MENSAKFASAFFALILLISSVSALAVNNVDYSQVTPGGESRVTLTLKNTLTDDIEDISLALDLSKVPFTAVGSAEDNLDELREGKSEDFIFTLKTSNDITPGDYTIPYAITYRESDNLTKSTKTGTFGITVSANPDLTFSVSAQNPVVGQESELTLRIVNKGFASAKFVAVKIFQDKFTLLSESEVYVGEVASDDFQTAVFKVIFRQENPNFVGLVEYKDFDNVQRTQTIEMPVTVYSREKALQMGIIKQSYAIYYVIAAIILVILWFVWRAISKRIKRRRSMQNLGGK